MGVSSGINNYRSCEGPWDGAVLWRQAAKSASSVTCGQTWAQVCARSIFRPIFFHFARGLGSALYLRPAPSQVHMLWPTRTTKVWPKKNYLRINKLYC